MDLFLVSEIKRPKDGSMEIKFFDRLKALEKLTDDSEKEDRATPFYGLAFEFLAHHARDRKSVV